MKLAKWNDKTAAYLDELLSREQTKDAHVIYTNTDKGCFFADKSGLWARFLPEHQIISANPQYQSSVLQRIFDNAAHDAIRAETITIGKAGKKKCRKFQNGDIEVYVYETLLREFPANADFFISGATKPVIVGLWENGVLHDIGLVMPFRVGATTGFLPA